MEKQRDRLKLRRWCIRRIIDGWPISKVADHAQTPQRTVHAWWNRFQWNGWVGLADASRRPHTIHRLPRETVEKVLEVRRTRGWCSEAIEAYLKTEGIQVSQGSIHTILKTNQMITKPCLCHVPRPHHWSGSRRQHGSNYVVSADLGVGQLRGNDRRPVGLATVESQHAF